MREQDQRNPVQKAAVDLLNLGFSVIPVHGYNHERAKSPTLRSWTKYQSTKLNSDNVTSLFRNGCSIAVIGGAVSGNLECLDFDKPDLFTPYLDTLEGIDAELAEKLVQRGTPSGGFHLIYRCHGPVSSSQKLAMGEDGKTWIETRGKDGYFLTTPSPGYTLIKHSLKNTPIITAKERGLLLDLAKSFSEQPLEATRNKTTSSADVRPGDDFNQRHSNEIPTMLEDVGWIPTGRTGPGGQHWTRPGKSKGTSATLKNGCFYNFSTNADIPRGPHDAFGVYTYLHHGGNFAAAARALAADGYGDKCHNKPKEIGQKIDRQKSNFNKSETVENILEDFAVTRAYVESLGKEEFLYPNLIIQGHILVIVAMSGGGKTTFLFREVVPYLVRYDIKVIYVDADSPASEHKAMKDFADEVGFQLLNPNVNIGTGVEQLLERFRKIVDGGVDLSGRVFIFDTLKKFTNLMSKDSVKDFYSLCRTMTARGATIVFAAHANKYRSPEGYLIPEGVGDVKNDTDDLILFERQKKDGGIDITSVVDIDQGAKTRGIFKPFSFHISADRKITHYDEHLELIDRTQTTKKAEDRAILKVAEEYIKSCKRPVPQRELVDYARAKVEGEAGAERVRKLIVQCAVKKGEPHAWGTRFFYTIGKRNAHQYELPGEFEGTSGQDETEDPQMNLF